MRYRGRQLGADADVRWGEAWSAYAVSLVVMLALGVPLFLLVEQSVWWLALAGALGMVAGGWLIARRRGGADVLSATLLAIVSFATMTLVIVGGTLGDVLPDPLPGLPIGDSTFFFVWPLAQLAAALLGTALGAWRPRRPSLPRRVRRWIRR